MSAFILLTGRVHVKSPREKRLLSTDKNPSIEKSASEDKRLSPYETLHIPRQVLTGTVQNIGTITNCVWMNKNTSHKTMTKVYISWRIMFDMVCEPL